MKNYLLVISAFLFIFLSIFVINIIVVKIFQPAVLSFLTINAAWLTKESSKSISSIILAGIYCIIIMFVGAFLYKTSLGRSLMSWFLRINKNIGIDLSKEATEKKIKNFGKKS